MNMTHGEVTSTDRRATIRVGDDLLLINVCSLVLVVVISLVDIEVLRIVLGLPFLLFFPGYAVVAALFPRKSGLGTVERIALSIGFSIVIAPLVGLMLNIVWAIRLYPILISLALFTAAVSAIAWYRRRGIESEDRPHLAISLPLGTKAHASLVDGVVSVVLAVALVGAIVSLVYFVANPRVGERYTEFYIVGAESSPNEVAVGEEATVVLGIVNGEHQRMRYEVEVLVGSSSLTTVGPIELAHGGTWEDQIGFVPVDACARTTLTQDVNTPYGPILAEVKSIQVASAQNLDLGDHIRIGEEAAEVEEIQGSTVILKDVLHEYHPVGQDVIEVQKVEFRLHKMWRLGETGETQLSLWIGKQSLSAGVLNQGTAEAHYRIEARIEGAPNEEPRVESAGPATVAVGEEWTGEVVFPFSEMHRAEFSLYNQGNLLFRRWESASYPSVYLWVHVTEGSLSV